MLQSRINIGDFDIKIVIENNTPTNDATYNNQVNSWGTFATVWAKEQGGNQVLGGSESFEAEQQVAKNRKQFMIRYSSGTSGVDEKMRVLYDSEYYYITIVNKMRREGWIIITAEKRDND